MKLAVGVPPGKPLEEHEDLRTGTASCGRIHSTEAIQAGNQPSGIHQASHLTLTSTFLRHSLTRRRIYRVMSYGIVM